MQHAVLPDHLGVWIGEEREAISPRLAELLRLGGRIHADRDNLDAPVMELAQVLLEPPQLGVAERSPIAAIEDHHNRAMALQQLRGSHLFSSDVLKDERRRELACVQGTLCRRDLLCKVENAAHEDPQQKYAEHGEDGTTNLATVVLWILKRSLHTNRDQAAAQEKQQVIGPRYIAGNRELRKDRDVADKSNYHDRKPSPDRNVPVALHKAILVFECTA
jgi:hypothetical protein